MNAEGSRVCERRLTHVLRREPEQPKTPSWHFGAWNGTPRDLTLLATRLQALLPDGSFKGMVEPVGDHPRYVTDQPAGLSEIAPDVSVRVVKIDIATRALEASIRVQLGGFLAGVACLARTELEARALLEGAKDAIDPGVPAYGRLRRSFPTADFLAVLGLAAALSAGVAVAVTSFTEVDWWEIFMVGFLVAAVPAYLVYRWLFPGLELHHGKTRRRRFAWGLFTLVLLPFALGAYQQLVG